ncbi:MAG: hypothetical protein ACRD4S_10655 [Candidatus Acidiferrales bacterium]
MFLGRNRGSAPQRHEVADDWACPLPRDKNQLFETVVRRWESGYAMMSVALDESFSLRARGELVCARQQVSIAAHLLRRLAAALMGSCDSLGDRGRHIANLPVVEPLKEEFFRGDTGRSAATWNGLLHRVLFGDRARFFHKVRILSGTIEELAQQFDENASQISHGTSLDPLDCWQKLECLHYDFTTCLREEEVILKSFLRALPSTQLAAFTSEVEIVRQPKRAHTKPALSRVSA